MKLETVYFDTPGPQNTAEALRIAAARGKELGIKKILVASTAGSSALAALDILKDFQVIIVTHVTGLKEPDVQAAPAKAAGPRSSR